MKNIFSVVLCVAAVCMAELFSAGNLPAATYEYPERITGDIFEKEGGYVHPFLSVSGMYTDNLYSSLENEIEDYAAVITPGIWLALPGRKTPVESIDTSVESAGGILVSPFDDDDSRRFSVFLSGDVNIERFKDHPEEDTETGSVETQLRYRAKSGLSLVINGQMNQAHRERGENFSGELEKYISSYGRARVGFNPNGKLYLGAGYSVFNVEYDETRFEHRERLDSVFFLSIGYPILPKTHGFIECRIYDIDYALASRSDWMEKHYNLGLRWRVSSKTQGIVKAGYGDRETEDAVYAEDFNAEARINYVVSSDTTVYMMAYKRYGESIYDGIDYRDLMEIAFGADYEITSKIIADLLLSVSKEDHYADEEKVFDENEFSVSPSVSYYLKKWAVFKMGYEFEWRSASDGLGVSGDALSNTVYFNVLLGI